MKQKPLKILAVFMTAIMSLALFGFNFTKADEIITISLDGEFSDWKDVPTLLTRSTLSYPNYKGTTYYWNNITDSWQTEALDDACMYNETRSLDLAEIKFANDANYLYFYWKRHSDYMDYFWKTFPESTDSDKMYVLDEAGFTSNPVATLPDPQVNQSSPPCAGEIIYNPLNYDHDMVYAFDTNLDAKYDYYLVMNVMVPQGMPGLEYSYTVTSYIYKDDGNGVYDGREAETLISDLGNDYQQYPSTVACENGVCQEGRIKIDKFFTDLGIKWGASTIVGYEAHSPARLFKSAKTVYDFNKKNKLGLQITKPTKKFIKTNKRSIPFLGKTKKLSKIKIYRNKKKVYQTKTAGEFSKLIPLKKGKNVIKVKAKRGKEKVIMRAVVMRKK